MPSVIEGFCLKIRVIQSDFAVKEILLNFCLTNKTFAYHAIGSYIHILFDLHLDYI